MIRKYQNSDSKKVLEIWEKASALAHPFLSEDFVHKVKNDMNEIYLPMAETWVFEEDKNLTGFISMIGNEIGGLFVLPGNQSKGTGTNLVNFILDLHDELEVEVFEQNIIGRSFYKKYGFLKIKEYIHQETNQVLIRMKYSKIE